MAPSQMDYPQQENEANLVYTHKKFNTGCYKHKKFGKRSSKEDTVTSTPLFRPYALSDNTPRKRRQESEQRHHQHQLPPTPPTTPPQQQQHHQQQRWQPQTYALPTPTATPTPIINHTPTTMPTPTPIMNHQAFAYVLQKQRAVLQMRHMLSINPDANTWPAELRNALYSMLQS
ncbi:protein shank [Drosophila novamexicana]|uniref:protein shank n=1 Tax=Drosophila novamexicana TaxID=47314 RepID=UPI0011E5C1CB|nr:protein shank [Drosophila novamexicana]